MKKTSFVVALSAVALGGLLLSGCGIFRSHKAWNTAQQESPLEIPPNLDRPSTSDALVIPPPGANQPTANGVTANVVSTSGQVADGFVLADNVDNAYRRVGDVLAKGDLGQMAGHDDTAHSYTLNVSASTVHKKGFFGRMFHHGSGSGVAEGNAHQVQVTIGASGANASQIRAQGDAAAVAKVVDTLKSSLGG